MRDEAAAGEAPRAAMKQRRLRRGLGGKLGAGKRYEERSQDERPKDSREDRAWASGSAPVVDEGEAFAQLRDKLLEVVRADVDGSGGAKGGLLIEPCRVFGVVDGGQAAEETAKEPAGDAVGDAVVAVRGEALKDGKDLRRDLLDGDEAGVAAEGDPATDAGEAVAGRDGSRAGAGGAVMAAERLAAVGGSAAFAAAGEDEDTFAELHGSSFQSTEPRKSQGP